MPETHEDQQVSKLEIMRPYLEKVGEPALLFAQMKRIEGSDARAINLEYEVSVTKMMTEGDSLCEWIVEKK